MHVLPWRDLLSAVTANQEKTRAEVSELLCRNTIECGPAAAMAGFAFSSFSSSKHPCENARHCITSYTYRQIRREKTMLFEDKRDTSYLTTICIAGTRGLKLNVGCARSPVPGITSSRTDLHVMANEPH